jgi:hypothetical protein
MNSITGDTLVPLLRRLHKNGDAFVWNGLHDPEIILMLRSNGDPSGRVMNFDLVLQYIDENDVNGHFFSIFNLDPSMEWNDDDENFYIENFVVEDDTEIEESVFDRFAAQLRQATCTRICDCGKYLVKDDGHVCYACMLSKTLADQRQCGICLENISTENSVESMNCCKQTFHRGCLYKFRRSDPANFCPICRNCTEKNQMAAE